MTKKSLTAAGIGLLAALAVGTALLAGGGGSPFPNVTIPGVPDKGHCCLVRIEKISTDTVRKYQFGEPYLCKVGEHAHKMVHGPATLSMPLTSGGTPCDENPKIIPNGSILEAKGVLTRRLDDGFSHFIGTFTIRKDKVVLFKGTVETIDNISTHHKPFGSDPCNLRQHLQGWLVGAGVETSLTNYTLRALLEAKIEPGTTGKQDTLIPAALDGVLIECH